MNLHNFEFISVIHRIHRILPIRCHQLLLGPPLPPAPGARMTVVKQTPSKQGVACARWFGTLLTGGRAPPQRIPTPHGLCHPLRFVSICVAALSCSEEHFLKRVELARLARIDGDNQVCGALLTVALLSPACLHSLCLDFALTLITH